MGENQAKQQTTIYGVIIQELKSFPDSRGFFREIIRATDPIFKNECFGQWSHSKMTKNVVKAWHYHHIQTDWWYVASGKIETVLYDYREESPTFKVKMVIPMGEWENMNQSTIIALKIPPGVLHGLKVISDTADLFYITSHTYNPNEEGRIPYNSSIVPHNFGENVIVSERDKKEFVPTTARKKLKV